MFGYAQGVICHARTAANVSENKNMNRDAAPLGTGRWPFIFGETKQKVGEEDGQPEDAQEEAIY